MALRHAAGRSHRSHRSEAAPEARASIEFTIGARKQATLIRSAIRLKPWITLDA
ncbi:hypothetical protein ACVBGC_15845 [Burkholderia stagnalis]